MFSNTWQEEASEQRKEEDTCRNNVEPIENCASASRLFQIKPFSSYHYSVSCSWESCLNFSLCGIRLFESPLNFAAAVFCRILNFHFNFRVEDYIRN